MFKVFIGLTAFFVSFLLPQYTLAAATTKLGSVAVKRSAAGVNIDLTFDRPFTAKLLKPVFERNFVQFVLRQARIDAAKIVAVPGGPESEVQKIFAYPYSPEIARVRVILKKDGAWAKGRISLWNNGPKSVRVFIKDASVAKNADADVARADRVATPPASGVKKSAEPESAGVAAATTDAKPNAPQHLSVAAAQQAAPVDSSAEEKKILTEVIGNTPTIDINNPDSVKAALGHHDEVGKSTADVAPSGPAGPAPITAPEKNGSIGIKDDPTRHFARMAIALFAVLGLFVGLAFGVKRYASKLKKLPFGKKERLIQVVATHYLGNKKSISLVKVAGEYLVVGASNDGVSLLSKLGPEVNVDRYLEDRFWGGTFEKHLDSYAKDPKVNKEIDFEGDSDAPEVPLVSAQAGAPRFNFDGARDLGAPPAEKQAVSAVRASIKEKLTKLKPLA